MKTADYDFELPPGLIAQIPARARDQSRLLILNRASGQIAHRVFRDFPEYLQPGDALVLNDSRVIPARLRGLNARTGGRFEILLLEEIGVNDWWVMLRPGKRARAGAEILILNPSGKPSLARARIMDINVEGHRRLNFFGTANLRDLLGTLGEIPLPPYIARPNSAAPTRDKIRYQTVYAARAGSVAAPTAGLHFTQSLLAKVRARGARVCFVTLHVGLGTFAPVKAENLAEHVMHEERYDLPEETARLVNETKKSGGRIFAVGTTTVRVLESVASLQPGRLIAGGGRTRIFIRPPWTFQVVDALLTNFHLPRSTLLMLVGAFAASGENRGREMVLSAYAEAVREQYRFFSYGDAMLIL